MTVPEFFEEAEREKRQDLETAKALPLWAAAVAWLRGYLAEEVKAKIRAVVGTQDWPAAYHMGWGMAVRNALRTHGFSEKDFRVMNLDNIYVELVEEAVSSPPAADTTPTATEPDLASLLADERAKVAALEAELARLSDAYSHLEQRSVSRDDGFGGNPRAMGSR